jgi:hypothetical protein
VRPVDPVADVHICDALISAWKRLIDCAPTATEKAMLTDGIASEQKMLTLANDDNTKESLARSCARTLVSELQAAPTHACDLGVSSDVQAAAEEILNRRTKSPRTGDPTLDAILDRDETLRDRACACATKACARDAANEFDHGLQNDPFGAFDHAPPAVRDAVSRIIEELGACTSIARTSTPP